MNKQERDNINVYELAEAARNKSDKAFETLSDYYYPVMVALYKEVTNNTISISFDEAMQAGKIGLFNAICYYRDDRNMSFNNFVRLCVRREMQRWVKRELRYSYYDEKPLVSLDYSLNDSDDITYMDTVRSLERSPEEKCRVNTLVESIFNKVPVSTEEGRILNYRLEGYSYDEISSIMSINKKRIDNSLRKSRKKIISLFD